MGVTVTPRHVYRAHITHASFLTKHELLEDWTHLFLVTVSPGADTIPAPNK